MYFTGRQYNSRGAWRVIKRCDNLYSGEETLMRFINYFGVIIGHMQGSRAECALARSVRKLIVLYFYDFRRRIVNALNIVSLCTQKIAMTVTRLSICSHWSWPSMSDDPGHWFLSISRPPPPSLQKKKSLGTSDYTTFEVPSTHCGKTFDPEAQTVCVGYQRWHKQVLWMLTCALPGWY